MSGNRNRSQYSSIRKLDFVLKLLVTNPNINPYASFDLIYSASLVNAPNVDALARTGVEWRVELLRILEKLISDGYLSRDDSANYRVTFNGEFCYYKGGYEKSIKNETTKKIIQDIKDILLIVGSFTAGIGALLLFFWEIYKHYKLHIN